MPKCFCTNNTSKSFELFCDEMRLMIKSRHPKAKPRDANELLDLLITEWQELKDKNIYPYDWIVNTFQPMSGQGSCGFNLFCNEMRHNVQVRHPKAKPDNVEEVLRLLIAEWYQLKDEDKSAYELMAIQKNIERTQENKNSADQQDAGPKRFKNKNKKQIKIIQSRTLTECSVRLVRLPKELTTDVAKMLLERSKKFIVSNQKCKLRKIQNGKKKKNKIIKCQKKLKQKPPQRSTTTQFSDHTDSSTLSGLGFLENALCESESVNLPSMIVPNEIATVTIPEEWQTTLDGKQFLFCEEGSKDRFAIFATEENLKILSECEVLFVDGTLKITAHATFKQLYSFLGKMPLPHGSEIFPLMFCFMSNKKEITYSNALKHLKSYFHMKKINVRWKRVVVDFTNVQMKAWNDVFPDVQLHGCNKSFNKTILKGVQDAGLSPIYRSRAEVKDYLKRVAGLAFLPVEHVEDSWVDLMEQSPEFPDDKNIEEMINKFHGYFTETWIEGKFPFYLWNCYNLYDERSNKRLRDWHCAINKLVAGKRPMNMCVLMTTLKSIQQETELNVRQGTCSAFWQKKRKKYTDVNDKLYSFKCEYVSGRLQLMSFLFCCGSLVSGIRVKDSFVKKN